MARTLPAGQTMWIAMADEYFEVEIVEKGVGGHVFKTGRKPKNPYLVKDDDDRHFVVGYDNLHDSPAEASVEMMQLAKMKSLASNPSEPGDEETDEDDEEPDDPDSDEDDDPE